MKLEELLTGKDGIGYPLLDHEVVMALMDISERLQRLEGARGVLIQLLEGLRLTASTTDVYHALTALLEELLDPVLAEQGKE